jgi:hypothetical protein
MLLSILDPRLMDITGLPSIDRNGDKLACVRLIAQDANGTGTRVAMVDNVSNVP